MTYAIHVVQDHILDKGWFRKSDAVPADWLMVTAEEFAGLSLKQVVTNENGHLVFGEVDEDFTFTEPEPVEAGDVE